MTTKRTPAINPDCCPLCGAADHETIDLMMGTIALQRETIEAYGAQIRRLGQCVVCGELDEQDGTRRNGAFLCSGCVLAPGKTRDASDEALGPETLRAAREKARGGK